MKCCGQRRETAFCPDCGQKLGEPSPLRDLLSYIRATWKGQENAAKFWSELRNHEQYQKNIKSATAAAAKWKAWGDSLAELMERAEAGFTEPPAAIREPAAVVKPATREKIKRPQVRTAAAPVVHANPLASLLLRRLSVSPETFAELLKEFAPAAADELEDALMHPWFELVRGPRDMWFLSQEGRKENMLRASASVST